MPSEHHRRAFSCLLLLLTVPSCAQIKQEKPATPATANESLPGDSQDIPEVPGLSAPLHGWNAGVTLASVHSSTTGWATLTSPADGYSFNDIFSIDATLPIYFFRLANTLSTHPRPDAELVTKRGELGDIVFGLHAQFIPTLFQYQVTGAFTAPTGDEAYGLTTGRVTFVTGHNVTEDNGFITALDIPIKNHVTFSGYYSRSLRLHTDTAAIGITYVLRSTQPPEDTSNDDLFR